MIIRNKTKSIQNFTVCGVSRSLRPGATAIIEDAAENDPVFGLLKRLDRIEVVTEEEKVEKAVEVDHIEPEIPLVPAADKAPQHLARMVQCSGRTKSGERCKAQVKVDEDEFDPERPYFCGRHEDDPSLYEKVNGEFVKIEVKDNAVGDNGDGDGDVKVATSDGEFIIDDNAADNAAGDAGVQD